MSTEGNIGRARCGSLNLRDKSNDSCPRVGSCETSFALHGICCKPDIHREPGGPAFMVLVRGIGVRADEISQGARQPTGTDCWEV